MNRAPFPPALERKLQYFFDTSTMSRGRRYFQGGAVMTLRFDGRIASSQVVGTEIYQTCMDWSAISHSGHIKTYCSCPDFQSGHLCKHLWAMVLECDKEGLTSKIVFRRAIQIIQSRQNLLEINEAEEYLTSLMGEIAADVPLVPQGWRKALSNISNFKDTKRLTQQVQKSCIVMEPDEVNDERVKFSVFTCELNHVGHVYSQPKQMVLPIRGKLSVGDASLKAAFKTLNALSQSEEDSFSGGYHSWKENKFLRIPTVLVQAILPGLLESVEVYISASDFWDDLNGVSTARLKYARLNRLVLEVTDSSPGFYLSGKISFGAEGGLKENSFVPVNELKKISSPNLFKFKSHVCLWDQFENERNWFEALKAGGLEIPKEDAEPFLETILNQPMSIQLPQSLKWKEVKQKPAAKVHLKSDRRGGTESGRYVMDLRFQYGSRSVSSISEVTKLPCAETQQIFNRVADVEGQIWNELPLIHLNLRNIEGVDRLVLSAKNLASFVKDSLEAGFPVDVDQGKVQSPGEIEIAVSSGVDWFDVNGAAEFAGLWIKFPSLLEAIQSGESFVPLPDGSMGILSEALKQKLEKLSVFAESSHDGLRFSVAQGLLLNSLLDDDENLKLDTKFKALRKKIKNFSGVAPSEVSETFHGRLRKYQKEGLGWLEFLESFGLGGILADDMGLGKTIQCLAFLEKRRTQSSKKRPPSLLLAPKTLLTNWKMEAEKFTPRLKVLVLAGTERESHKDIFNGYDLVLTTYQTMLRDLEKLKELKWDCVILDEAQAIKNAGALISKAAKTLPASFRLAMTGTPIENSIQDLFSISDFVNPGFLRGKNRSAHLKLNEDSKQVLAKAFKPVILRRTKDQVLKDLPAKTEQMIAVELEPKQLKAYNELKKFYQVQLLKEVNDNGVKKSQIQILAALTRLRQAALHTGLIDPSQASAKSAKFEIVLEMLDEVLSEGHRVLIFSQFTSLLGLFKTELKKKNIDFCYLDGKTTNRQQVVDDFKSKSFPVFLMSLKAGGVGLNLVEADYVFLLDPWWNPAAETQAIDRAHRIGQTRAVNAYRFIAKDTVEEKILELQKTKRGISAEILDGQSSLIRNLTAQDIENLLS